MAQQLKGLTPEDLALIRGSSFTGLPCGAPGPNHEEALERNKNYSTIVDRTKWLTYFRRAKNVQEGYEKWWASVTISLRDGRRIILDGNGFFCIRTKDPKVFYYYQLDRKDFDELKASWNAIKDKEK
jgi:hypothetical protein